jgi:hypothetical protein
MKWLLAILVVLAVWMVGVIENFNGTDHLEAARLMAENADWLEGDVGFLNREVALLRQQLTEMADIAEACEVSR